MGSEFCVEGNEAGVLGASHDGEGFDGSSPRSGGSFGKPAILERAGFLSHSLIKALLPVTGVLLCMRVVRVVCVALKGVSCQGRSQAVGPLWACLGLWVASLRQE